MGAVIDIEQHMPDSMRDTRRPQENLGSEGAEQARHTRDTTLALLGQRVEALRDQAVTARRESGIEETWLSCEEAYLGIDDANRNEIKGAQWTKPQTMEGPLTRDRVAPPNGRSTVFVPITSRYVDIGAAKISEITLPIDDKAFELKATEIPDMVEASKSMKPLAAHPVTGIRGKVMRMLGMGEQPAPGVEPDENGQVPATEGDLAKAKLAKADKAAKKAEKRIYDWMQEAKYPSQMRRVIHDAARLGVGVFRCPEPQVKARFAMENGKIIQKRKLVPGMRWVNPWNFFPDGTCGENIQDGDFACERDTISPGRLRRLKKEVLEDGTPIYVHDMIDQCLREGPGLNSIADSTGNENDKRQDGQFVIWYFVGTITRDEFRSCGGIGDSELPDEMMDVDAIVTMVNGHVIRATPNPLTKSGNIGYRTMPWSRRAGHWAGKGIAEQMDVPQRMANGSTRALLNNAGVSAGPQIVIQRTKAIPADGNYTLFPNKVWYGEDGVDVREIFQAFNVTNVGSAIQAVIEYAFRLAEECTNIPLVVQGKDSQNAPETFGQAELQNSNAHTLLRSIAIVLDDNITEPVVLDLYEWLLLDDDVPVDEKGDFDVHAQGSSAMVEKAIQEQTLSGMLTVSKDPAFGLNPKKVMKKWLQAKRFNPEDVSYTEAELEQMAKQPPPKDPRIEAAEIAGQFRLKAAELDRDRDTIFEQATTERTKVAAEGQQAELEVRERIAMLNYATQRNIKLDDVKASLTKTSMELRTQLLMAGVGDDEPGTKPAPQVATPAVEPAGRAKDGHAFEQ